jgi:hypothetical protein
MANPNIVNVSDIRGKTEVLVITTTPSAIVSNDNASNTIIKVNSLVVSNVDTDNHEVTVDIFRSSTARRIAHKIVVPANASLIVISKDSGIYLEEGDSLRITGSGENFTNNDLESVCSYEEIS